MTVLPVLKPSAAASARDRDSRITDACVAQADEHLDAFGSWLGDDRQQDERSADVARFQAIPRTPDYSTAWNRSGRKLGTPLWKAACRQRVAQASDDIVRSAIKHRATGLAALVDQCEREWRRAHQAALGESEAARA